MNEPAERITLIEEWQGETRTRYILKPDGRRELLDITESMQRPFVRFIEPMDFSFKDAKPGRVEMTREQIAEIWPSWNRLNRAQI